jgi:hypothetical protein
LCWDRRIFLCSWGRGRHHFKPRYTSYMQRNLT